MLPIAQVAHRKLGINLSDLLLYGHYKAKISLDYLRTLEQRPNAKLILVTAITPTAAGEGKTTTTVGLGDALNHIGKQAIICLREPSLGPCFGVKGGAAGGGYAQVVPMEDINLHFTGDFHAIGVANNLLASLIDNQMYWGNSLGLDARRISWRRAVDMNDRSLREIAIALGGVGNGFPRQDGFDIIAASEIMAVFCLAENIDDLKRRLGNIVVGQTRDRKYIHACTAGSCRRDDGVTQGRFCTEPGTDRRKQSGADSWRAIREYCARLQFRHRDEERLETGRLRRDRSRISALISAPKNSWISNAARPV